MTLLRSKRKKQTNKKWIILSVLMTFFLIASIILLLLYPFASSQKQTYFTGDYPILYQGEQAGNALIDGGTVYVPLSFMKNNIDETIFYDEKSKSIIITTVNKVVQMPTDSLTYYVNEQPVELHLPSLQTKDNELYVALNSLLDYYPIDFTILPDKNAVWIQMDGEKLHLGQVTEKNISAKKLRLRVGSSVTTPYTAEVESLEKLYIEDKVDNFYFVRKMNGVAGFIKKEFVVEGSVENVVVDHDIPERDLKKIDGPINLTWEAVYTRNPKSAEIPNMNGVNVVSPTWFELIDQDGAIKSLGSNEYMNWAKSKGYEVWGLFSNGFDPQLTHAAFKDYETRQTIIRQLLHFSNMYDLNGLNIDIENVNEEDGPLITQFMREATPYFREAGLVVSMDITFIAGGNWSAFYEREKLADIVDYLVVMAYDEHWGSSPQAGSVASFPWVESNLQRLLEVVPNDQLILGIPLYTRLWKEELQENGEITVSSQALSMEKVQEWMTERNLSSTYDDQTGQNYLEYFDEDEQSTYKVWLEDEMSLRKRAQIAIDYELAGVASWARYFADPTAWTALHEVTKQTLTKK